MTMLPPPPPTGLAKNLTPLPGLIMRFPPDVAGYLRDTHAATDEIIDSLTATYLEWQPKISGAPLITQLTRDDAQRAYEIATFELDRDKDWSGFSLRVKRCEVEDEDRTNPYVPSTASRSETQENPWTRDVARFLPNDAQTTLKQRIREASPSNSTPMAERIACSPSDDNEFMLELVEAMVKLGPKFNWSLGDDESHKDEFRFGPFMCLMMGLGSSAFRCYCHRFPEQPALAHWAFEDDESLADDVREAHACSGYPIGLFRLEWTQFITAVRAGSFIDAGGYKVPRAFKAMALLHILKHARLRPTADGTQYELITTYRGESSIQLLDESQMKVDFHAVQNRNVATSMAKVLNLPKGKKKDEDWAAYMVAEILGSLRPSELIATRPVTTMPELIAAPAVSVRRSVRPGYEKPWVNPGLWYENVARINLDTGKVDMDYLVEGETLVAISWPLAFNSNSQDDISKWRNTVPHNVKPSRASVVLRKYIRNLNSLGFPEGFDALLDATLTVDFARLELSGSVVGGAISKEYPLIFTLPMGHTMAETTNQGKTIVCRIIGGSMVPGMDVVVMNGSTSAPVQRSLGSNIRAHGTMILDEFLLPTSPEHFLSDKGLQALATGGEVTIGEAGGNALPSGLKHPLVINAKSALAPTDVLNRMLAIYLDVLTPATMSTEEELSNLLNGKVALEMRLAHLLWMRENDIVSKIRRIEHLESGKWRFNGHLSVACLIEDKAKVEGYLEASRNKARAQLEEAGRSGLIDQMGGTPKFDPTWFFTHASQATLQALYVAAGGPKAKTMDMANAWRLIIEDSGFRTYSGTLSASKIREPQANQAYRTAFERGPLKRRGWTLVMDEVEGENPVLTILKDGEAA